MADASLFSPALMEITEYLRVKLPGAQRSGAKRRRFLKIKPGPLPPNPHFPPGAAMLLGSSPLPQGASGFSP